MHTRTRQVTRTTSGTRTVKWANEPTTRRTVASRSLRAKFHRAMILMVVHFGKETTLVFFYFLFLITCHCRHQSAAQLRASIQSDLTKAVSGTVACRFDAMRLAYNTRRRLPTISPIQIRRHRSTNCSRWSTTSTIR